MTQESALDLFADLLSSQGLQDASVGTGGLWLQSRHLSGDPTACLLEADVHEVLNLHSQMQRSRRAKFEAVEGILLSWRLRDDT